MVLDFKGDKQYGYNVEPWTGRPTQCDLIRYNPNVRKLLGDFGLALFARQPTESRFVLTEDLESEDQVLYGNHIFKDGSIAETEHVLHAVPKEYSAIEGDDPEDECDVSYEDDQEVTFLLEACNPEAYPNFFVDDYDGVKALEALIEADTKDSEIAQSN